MKRGISRSNRETQALNSLGASGQITAWQFVGGNINQIWVTFKNNWKVFVPYIDIISIAATQTFHYGNWCGPGGSGAAIDPLDGLCKQHDVCFDAADATSQDLSGGGWQTLSPAEQAKILACNQALCSGVELLLPTLPINQQNETIAAEEVLIYFTAAVPKGAQCQF